MPSVSQHTGARLQISPLAGSLLLVLASLPRPAAFRVLFVSLGAALALLLIDTHGPSAVAGKLTGIIALLTAAAAGYVLLATASRAKRGLEYPLRRPSAR
jgi:succinate-acetate transporter protein